MSVQPPSQADPALAHRPAQPIRLRLAASCFLLYAFYTNFGLWSDNEQIRYALAKAIVEHRSLQVDPYREHLGLDKALRDGHIYCDKPPGSSFLIVPQYLLAKCVISPAQFSGATERLRAWLVICLSVCLYAGVSVGLLHGVLGRLGVTRGRICYCYAYAIGTMAFPYATVMVGEQFAAPLVIACLWAALRGDRRSDLMWLGALVGLTFVTHYQAILVVGWLIPLKWATMKSKRDIAWAVIPAMVFFCLLLGYNTICFGGPLNLSYSYWAGKAQFKLGLPTLEQLHWATFSSWKGLFYYSPWLLFFALGISRAWVERRWWAAFLVVAPLCFLGFMLLNNQPEGHKWWVGDDFGPRKFLPAVPVLAIGAALGIERLLDRAGTIAARRLVMGVAAVTVAWGAFACSLGAMLSPVTYELLREDGAYYVQRRPHEPKVKLEGVTNPLLDTTLRGLLTFGSNNIVTQLSERADVGENPTPGQLALNLATNVIAVVLMLLPWWRDIRKGPFLPEAATNGAASRSRFPVLVLAAAAVVYLILRFWGFVAHNMAIVSYPFEICAAEGILLNQGRLLAAGRTIYMPVGEYPFLISHFPPVTPALLSLGVKLFGIAFWPGRLVSFLSALVAASAVYWLASSGNRRKVSGLSAALLFTTSSWLAIASVQVGVDSLALALSLVGVCVVAHRQTALRGVVAGVFLALAVLTRQTQVAGLLAVCVWLWLGNRKARWPIVCTWAGVVCMVVLAVDLATRGHFHRHVVTHTAGQLSLRRLLLFFRTYAEFHVGLLALAAVFVWQQWRRREMGLLSCYLVTAYLLACTCARQGSGQTYFIEAIAVTSAAAGVAIGRLWAESRRHPWAFLVAILLAVAALEEVRLRPGTAATPSPAHRRETAVLLGKLKRLGPPILSEYSGMVLQAGGELLFQPYAFAMLASNGGWDDRRLAKDILGHKFSAVVVDRVDRGRWTPDVYRALEEAYGVEGKYWFYLHHTHPTRLQLLVPRRTVLPTVAATIAPRVMRPKSTPRPNDLGAYAN